MSENRKYSLPNFVVEKLTTDFSLSENDIEKLGDVYSNSANFNYPSANTKQNWQTVITSISNNETVIKKETPTFRINYWWSAAAIVILGLTFVFLQNSKSTNEFASLKTYETLDEIKKITLEDGSVVHLNRFSKLSVNFSNTERKVNLNGEAFFSVVHNNQHFLVETKAGFVEVLGTEFNVKNRKNIPLSVALVKGSIQFNTASNKIAILPGECITQKDEKTFVKSYVNEASVKNWIQNKLVFEDKTLKEIIESLQLEYNVEFDYNVSLANEKLTITFDRLTASQAAELLSKTLSTSVKVK